MCRLCRCLRSRRRSSESTTARSSIGARARAARPGEVGEIVVKGPQVTREYFNAPGHTRLAKINDGATVRHRMGDLGYFDDRGRLWFCGRKTQRVQTEEGTLYTVPCESVFNTHPEVFRTALVGVGEAGEQVPVLCVELEKDIARSEHDRIRSELLAIGAEFDHTRQIRECSSIPHSRSTSVTTPRSDAARWRRGPSPGSRREGSGHRRRWVPRRCDSSPAC